MLQGDPSHGGQPRRIVLRAAFCPLHGTVTLHKILIPGTSLAPWLRSAFQCRGYEFNPWPGNQDPTCCGAAKAGRCNY